MLTALWAPCWRRGAPQAAPERLQVALEEGEQALTGGPRHVLVPRVGVAGLFFCLFVCRVLVDSIDGVST